MTARRSLFSEIAHRAALAVKAVTRGQIDAAGGGRRWKDDRRALDASRVILGDASTVAARAAAFVLNSPHGMRIVESLAGNLVGAGIVPRPMVTAEALRTRLATDWTAWTDEADAEGRADLYGLEAAAVRDLVTFGEAVFVWTASAATAVPQLRRLHPEQLDRAKVQLLPNGGAIVQGVETSPAGRIVAYWLRPSAPGDALAGMPLVSQRFPAGDVLHVFRPLFPGQVRGLSWFAPVLLSAHELAQLVDAMLVRARVAALHAGFVTDTDGQSSLYEGTQTGATLDVAMEPGALVVLPPGKNVEFSEPPDAGNTPAFADAILRMIAAGVGVTFEQLTGDYSKVNYSSARAALLEFRRFAEGVQHHCLVFQFCRPVWDRFIRWEVLTGAVPATLYQRDRAALHAVKWLPPAWAWVDPLKDVQAAVVELDNNLRSRSEIVAERGYDIEALDAEIAADQSRADRLGLRRPAPAAAINTNPEEGRNERL